MAETIKVMISEEDVDKRIQELGKQIRELRFRFPWIL